MRYYFTVLPFYLFLFAIIGHEGLTGQGMDHAAWDAQLRNFVDENGQVNYKAWKKEQASLDSYLAQLASKVPPPNASSDEALTYWINAYNAFTVKMILKNYPVQSIMDIHGGKVWDHKWIDLGGKLFSLNQIEHEILRKDFKIPEIHFAVNCAARSCPPLWNKAFRANTIHQDLQSRASLFINDARYNLIYPDQIRISNIFNWYKEDFGDLREYLNKFSQRKINPATTIQFIDYDWALNAK